MSMKVEFFQINIYVVFMIKIYRFSCPERLNVVK